MKKTLIVSMLLTSLTHAAATINQPVTHSVTVGGQEYVASDSANVKLLTINGTDWLSNAFSPSAAYTVLANAEDSTVGRYQMGNSDVTGIHQLGTLVIASGSYKGTEDGEAKNYTAGQLFLNCGGTISNNMILGESGYVEKNGQGARASQYEGAIRFHNDKEDLKLVLTGNISLVQNTQMSVGGTSVGGSNAYIEGAISGEGMNLNLTQSGTLALSGGATLKTLSGTANVMLADKKSDGTTSASSKNYELVNATGGGTLTIGSGVSLVLLGDKTDTSLQTTDKTIVNSHNTLGSGATANAGILIGKSDTANTVILTKAQNYGAVHVRGNNTLKIDCIGEADGHFDLNGQNSIYSGKLIVGSKARLTARSNLWFNEKTNSGIDILDGGQLTRDIMVISTQQGETATIRRSKGNGGTNLAVGNGDVTLSNAVLTIQDATSETIVSLNLVDSSLKNNSGAVVRENNAKNTSYVAVEAAAGNIVFAQKSEGLSVVDLTLADNKSVTTWSGTINQSAYSTITVKGALNAGTNSSVLNNLVLSDGVNLDFAGSVTLNGTLTLGTGITLAENMVLGDSYTLFTGVTGLTVAGESYTKVVDASTVFDITEGTYNLVFSEGSLKLETPVVPEPTTATLSLLALAGLAARRRRK